MADISSPCLAHLSFSSVSIEPNSPETLAEIRNGGRSSARPRLVAPLKTLSSTLSVVFGAPLTDKRRGNEWPRFRAVRIDYRSAAGRFSRRCFQQFYSSARGLVTHGES